MVNSHEARSAELAITNLISNKREWNNCFIKFSAFGCCCWSLLNFILSKNFFQIKMTGCWGNFRPKRQRCDHMTRASLCERSEWKIENEVNRTQPDISNSRNVQVCELQPFWDKHSSVFWSSSSARSVIVVHIWANVLLCGAERRKRFFMPNWIRRRRFKTLKASIRQVQVCEEQPHWDKHSVQVFKLQVYREA